jgi:hypothetical protein
MSLSAFLIEIKMKVIHRHVLFVCLTAAATACLVAACANATSGTPANAVGADRDAHGCIGSAGYSWCEYTQRCERPWELAKQKGFELSAENFAHYCAAGTVK